MTRRTFRTVDLFCGAGGASTGIHAAAERFGLRHQGVAVNHWDVAVATMRTNHAWSATTRIGIEAAVPSEVVSWREVDLLWASPSCTHHSRAKGGKPRDNQLRSQPELIFAWLDQLFVRRLIVENVPEFVDWGPLGRDGRPIERLRGASFRAWISAIEARNFRVDWRVLNCADFGDATTRKRLFVKAVRVGCGSIRWPEPTHAARPEEDLFGGGMKPWRGAIECLDLADTGASLFSRKNPLAADTLRRVAAGAAKYWGVDLRPFLVLHRNNQTCASIDAPLSTIACSGAHHGLCTPLIIDHNRHGKASPPGTPLGALTTHDRFSVCQLLLGQQSGAGAAQGVALEDGRVLDVRFRMLKPSELAAAHSFPAGYVLAGTRADQVKQIGNSVPVRTAEALVAADLGMRP